VRHRERSTAGVRRRAVFGALLAVAGAAAIASCNTLTGVSQLSEVDSSARPMREAGGGDAHPSDARIADGRVESSRDGAEDAPRVCTACGGPTSASCCSGTCVDLASNPSHCGACNSACSSGVCGTAISGWPSSAWNANGSASIEAGQFGAMTGVLTVGDQDLAGTIVYAHPVIVDSFTASFSFYMGGGSADVDAGVELGGDGMMFVFESEGPHAVTNLGSCFGVCGLTGFGVELDTYDNDGCGDMSANHVAVDVLTECTADSALLPTTLLANDSLPFTLSDGMIHTAVVELDKGKMTVALDGTMVVASFPIPGFVEGKSYYFGFGAGTGGYVNFHEVGPDLTIAFPTPRCL
jgi:Bacterial lectin/Stigma-specific protein, Stig1